MAIAMVAMATVTLRELSSRVKDLQDDLFYLGYDEFGPSRMSGYQKYLQDLYGLRSKDWQPVIGWLFVFSSITLILIILARLFGWL